MQLLSCARAWERLSKLLDELLLVCEASKVRAAPPPALTQYITGSLIACLLSPAYSSPLDTAARRINTILRHSYMSSRHL